MRGRGPIALLPVWMGRVCLLSGAKHRESSEVLKTVRHDCSMLASAGTGQGALTDGTPCGERESASVCLEVCPPLLQMAWRGRSLKGHALGSAGQTDFSALGLGS